MCFEDIPRIRELLAAWPAIVADHEAKQKAGRRVLPLAEHPAYVNFRLVRGTAWMGMCRVCHVPHPPARTCLPHRG